MPDDETFHGQYESAYSIGRDILYEYPGLVKQYQSGNYADILPLFEQKVESRLDHRVSSAVIHLALRDLLSEHS